MSERTDQRNYPTAETQQELRELAWNLITQSYPYPPTPRGIFGYLEQERIYGKIPDIDVAQLLYTTAIDVMDKAKNEEDYMAGYTYLSWCAKEGITLIGGRDQSLEIVFKSATMVWRDDLDVVAEEILNKDLEYHISDALWLKMYLGIVDPDPAYRRRAAAVANKILDGVVFAHEGSYFKSIEDPDKELPSVAIRMMAMLGRYEILEELITRRGPGRAYMTAGHASYGYGLGRGLGFDAEPIQTGAYLLELNVTSWAGTALEEVRTTADAGLANGARDFLHKEPGTER